MSALISDSKSDEADVNITLSLDTYQSTTSLINNQSSSDDEAFSGYSLPMVILLSTLLASAMVMALVGNSLVILTILRNKDMRTRTNLLLSNLALADILVALLDIPVALYTIIVGDWNFSHTFCEFNGYFVGLGFMLSIHTLMWISIHKFISITKPFARAMTPGKIFCMMVAAWSWSLLYNVGPLVGWTQTIYKPGASQCGPVVPKTPLQLSHSLTNTVFNFIIPICVMSYCYYKIFAEVREHMNRLQEFADVRIRTTILQQRRISMTLFIVLMCFLLCWLPYILYSCTLVALGTKRVKPIFNPLAYLAGYINSACNPIIYALRSPSFRKGFQEILCGSQRVPEWQRRLIRREFATLSHQQTLGVSEKPRQVSIQGQRSIAYGHRSISNGHQKPLLICPTRNLKGSSSVASSSVGQTQSANLQSDSPGSGEQTFKWTRVNGFVISFRRSVKTRSKSSPNLVSESKDKSMIQEKIHKYSLAEPTPELKAFNQRRSNGIFRQKIITQEADNFKIVPEETDKMNGIINAFQGPSSGSSDHSALLRNKTQTIVEDVFSFPENSKAHKSYFPDESRRFNFSSNLENGTKRWSRSAPDLMISAITSRTNEREESQDQTYLTEPETAYLRTNSERDVKVFTFDETASRSKEPPHLVWKASVEEINFISVPKSGRSKSLLNSSQNGAEDGCSGGLLRKTEQTHSSMRLGIVDLISTFKRSIGDLFSASVENLEESSPSCRRYQKRPPSDSSIKGGSESESSILISKL